MTSFALIYIKRVRDPVSVGVLGSIYILVRGMEKMDAPLTT